jgi:selenium metabolism protein YedF
MISKVDLRGLLCPEPVLATKKLLDDPQVERVEALVDDDVCVNNLQRLSRTFGASTRVRELDGFFEIVIDRAGAQAAAAEQAPESSAGELPAETQGQKVGTVIFLAKDTFGDGDPEFSRTLVNLFLQTALESGHRPRAILMANSGVKLMAPDSPVLKVLNDFRQSGCEVLACGLCLEFYGLKDKVPKEQVTNMFAICEYLFAADKVLQF